MDDEPGFPDSGQLPFPNSSWGGANMVPRLESVAAGVAVRIGWTFGPEHFRRGGAVLTGPAKERFLLYCRPDQPMDIQVIAEYPRTRYVINETEQLHASIPYTATVATDIARHIHQSIEAYAATARAIAAHNAPFQAEHDAFVACTRRTLDRVPGRRKLYGPKEGQWVDSMFGDGRFVLRDPETVGSATIWRTPPANQAMLRRAVEHHVSQYATEPPELPNGIPSVALRDVPIAAYYALIDELARIEQALQAQDAQR